MNKKLGLAASIGSIFVTSSAWAAGTTLIGHPVMDSIMSTVLYSAIGIIMAFIGYKCIDILTPGDLGKDIAKNNIALAILTGLTMLGICIIIAAVLAS